MKEWLEAGGAIPPDPALKRDLCTGPTPSPTLPGNSPLRVKIKCGIAAWRLRISLTPWRVPSPSP